MFFSASNVWKILCWSYSIPVDFTCMWRISMALLVFSVSWYCMQLRCFGAHRAFSTSPSCCTKAWKCSSAVTSCSAFTKTPLKTWVSITPWDPKEVLGKENDLQTWLFAGFSYPGPGGSIHLKHGYWSSGSNRGLGSPVLVSNVYLRLFLAKPLALQNTPKNIEKYMMRLTPST